MGKYFHDIADELFVEKCKAHGIDVQEFENHPFDFYYIRQNHFLLFFRNGKYAFSISEDEIRNRYIHDTYFSSKNSEQ